MKIKTVNREQRAYYVILTGEIDNPVVFGGSHNLRFSERIMKNPLAFPKGAWKTMITFPNEKAAKESKYGRGLQIANGRFVWRPLSRG
tara:strand:+ start:156 stop:419 length:264 start_codon:yes stop_codon:yes gene_type:complete